MRLPWKWIISTFLFIQMITSGSPTLGYVHPYWLNLEVERQEAFVSKEYNMLLNIAPDFLLTSTPSFWAYVYIQWMRSLGSRIPSSFKLTWNWSLKLTVNDKSQPLLARRKKWTYGYLRDLKRSTSLFNLSPAHRMEIINTSLLVFSKVYSLWK